MQPLVIRPLVVWWLATLPLATLLTAENFWQLCDSASTKPWKGRRPVWEDPRVDLVTDFEAICVSFFWLMEI